MRIDSRSIHLQRPIMGLGDATSDAARARRMSLSPGMALGPQPSITSMSANSGKAGDYITVTTDQPADGLIFLNPTLPGQVVTVDSIDSGQGTKQFVFRVPGTQTQEFPWPAGTYDLRAWATANDNFSPNSTSFTVQEYVRPAVQPPANAYIPPGVTLDPVTGQWNVPGSSPANLTSPAPPAQTSSGLISSGVSPAPSSSTFTMPAILTESSFAGIPNWVLLLGALGAFWFFGRKK